MSYGKIKVDSVIYDDSGSDVEKTIATLATPTPEGTVVKSTGESGTTKFLRVDGDGTCSWQVPPDTNTQLTLVDEDDMSSNSATSVPSQQSVKAYVDTADALKAPTANPTFTGTVNAAALTLSGDLTVSGTTTTVSSTTVEVADKNLELGKVSTPTDTTADGGGITLKGATDKTFNWVDATDAWTSSEHIHLGDSKKIMLGGASGATSDASLYHEGADTWLRDSGTGRLYLDSDGDMIALISDGSYSNGKMATFIKDGAVRLYHDNSLKLDTTTAGVTVSGSVTDDKGDVRKIPANAKTSAYTLIASDAGKHINITTGGVTVAQNIFATGDAITIVNNSGSDQTLTQGSGVTIYNSADASTGNRTLAGRGMATLICTGANEFYISGAGLT